MNALAFPIGRVSSSLLCSAALIGCGSGGDDAACPLSGTPALAQVSLVSAETQCSASPPADGLKQCDSCGVAPGADPVR